MSANSDLYRSPENLESEFSNVFEEIVLAGREISYRCPGFVGLSQVLQKTGNMTAGEVRNRLENIMNEFAPKWKIKKVTICPFEKSLMY